MSLFNGQIFVLLEADRIATVSLLSDGLYLSDARLHSVTLDFTLPTR